MPMPINTCNHIVVGSSEKPGCENILEFWDVPHGALENLKNASMNKKMHTIINLRLKAKIQDDLVCIDKDDPVLGPLLEKETYYE